MKNIKNGIWCLYIIREHKETNRLSLNYSKNIPDVVEVKNMAAFVE